MLQLNANGGEVDVPRKLRELRADLRRNGARKFSQVGSHEKWKHPLVNDYVMLAGADGDDAKPYQEKDVKRLISDIRAAEQAQRRKQP
jgi:hypothetical protein